MVTWLTHPGARDIRFLLRHALHGPGAIRERQTILIDCPPRLTTACVNALAASDYVLVPVQLDMTDAERVPMLLKWLAALKEAGVCEHLYGVALVASKTFNVEGERSVWAELPALCGTTAGSQLRVTFLPTGISQNSRYREAAKGRFPAVLRGTVPFKSIRQEFEKLDAELNSWEADIRKEALR